MKKEFVILVFLSCFGLIQAQHDTLFTKKNKKIPCKIIEVTELDIKYAPADNPDGPVYNVSKGTVVKYILANGYTELIITDELSLENPHEKILKRKKVIKINPFSLVNSQVSFAYEELLTRNVHIDIEVGYINSAMNKNPLIKNNAFNNDYNSSLFQSGWTTTYQSLNPVLYTGGYIKPGLKLLVGEDVSAKGLRYAHPLKGRYIRLEAVFSYLNFSNVTRYIYNNGVDVLTRTNVNSLAYGGFVNYGRQFILGNILTLEYYIGIGFTAQSTSYSNPDYLKQDPRSSFRDYNDAKRISNYHGFQRSPGGLSGTLGLRLGYIIPPKKVKSSLTK